MFVRLTRRAPLLKRLLASDWLIPQNASRQTKKKKRKKKKNASLSGKYFAKCMLSDSERVLSDLQPRNEQSHPGNLKVCGESNQPHRITLGRGGGGNITLRISVSPATQLVCLHACKAFGTVSCMHVKHSEQSDNRSEQKHRCVGSQ